MSKLFFGSENCQGADLPNGHRYNTDKSGMLNVSDPADIKALKAGGYIEVGSMPTRVRCYYICDPCNWDALVNHCPKCDSSDLRKVTQ